MWDTFSYEKNGSKYPILFGFTIQYAASHFLGNPKNDSIVFESHQKGKAFHFSKQYFQKFSKDKVFQENENYVIGLDGVVLNLDVLKPINFTLFDWIIQQYEAKNTQIINHWKGEFALFIFVKSTEELLVLMNKTATKQVFYTYEKDLFALSFSMKILCVMREKAHYTNTLNEQSVYSMYCFGGFYENNTLVNEIKKLNAAEFVIYKNNSVKLDKYYDYSAIAIKYHSEKAVLSILNDQFNEAIQLAYQKDKTYHYAHLATLSGGLDSRMNVLTAHHLISENIDTFCFSQSGYLDQMIAEKIANDYKMKHQFIALDGSSYLKNVAEMHHINQGAQFFNGAAHYHYALQKIDLNAYGLIHTGQIGDAILGGFVSKNNGKENYLSKAFHTAFIDLAIPDKNSLKKYRDEEIFKLYQRIFNVTNYGSFVVENQKTYLVSPFFDSDFMETALAINPSLKYNQNIYLKWINTYYKEVTNYKWERTGLKPNALWKTELARYTKKIKNEWYKAFGKENKLSMTPDEYWFKKDSNLQDFYKHYFKENIDRLAFNNTLLEVSIRMFETGNLEDKVLVMTILEAIKTFNLTR